MRAADGERTRLSLPPRGRRRSEATLSTLAACIKDTTSPVGPAPQVPHRARPPASDQPARLVIRLARSVSEAAHGARQFRLDPARHARRAHRLVRRRREAAGGLRHRYRARGDSVLPRDPRACALCWRARHSCVAGGVRARDRLGADRRRRPHHRPVEPARRRRDLDRAGRPIRALGRAVAGHPRDRR